VNVTTREKPPKQSTSKNTSTSTSKTGSSAATGTLAVTTGSTSTPRRIALALPFQRRQYIIQNGTKVGLKLTDKNNIVLNLRYPYPRQPIVQNGKVVGYIYNVDGNIYEARF
jgi:hypothetical protein